MELIQEAVDNGAREFKACNEIGISLRTLQRWRSKITPSEDQRPHAVRPTPKNKLTDDEKEEIINVVNQPQYQSLPPSQIVPDLADKGIYIASESSFYRVLHEHDLQKHRGKSKAPQKRPISTHYATGPNQVWMWDITYLPGPVRGTYYYLYLILDLFSRKVVGWDIWLEQTAPNASQLVRRSVINEKIRKSKEPLVLHSDNGSPMKGATLLATLYELGITPSRSRPRVSNDNPYAESIFKTCKYRPDFPDNGFNDMEEARRWVFQFVQWYNYEHKHSGIKYLTPHQRHSNQGDEILNKRKEVYEQAKLKHPERWSRKTRDWDLKGVVWLNPEKENLLPEEIKKQSS